MLNNVELKNYLEKFFDEKKLKLDIKSTEDCQLRVKFMDKICLIHFNYFSEIVSYTLTYNYGSIFKHKDYTNPDDLAKGILDWFTGKMGIPVSYVAEIFKGKKNYSGCFVDFDGCVFADKDFYKCIQRAKGALALHLEGMLEDGEPLPIPKYWERNERDKEEGEESYLVLIETEIKLGDKK